ncbi:hypothetical protein [Thalassospira povalilytica]|uniref:hypothetical protein n=1 Tax=Thalassospira povalilytica TaxID=732237 RepID=UPI003AA9913C
MLPLFLKDEFYKFWNALDKRVSSDSRDGEVQATNSLLRCLNAEEPLADFEPTVMDFREGVLNALRKKEMEGEKNLQDLEQKFNFDISVQGFTQVYEGKVSQADFGLHLEFEDTSQHVPAGTLDWSSVYLVQAKSWDTDKPLKNDGSLLDIVFIDTEYQSQKIEIINQFFRDCFVKYAFYCRYPLLRNSSKDEAYAMLKSEVNISDVDIESIRSAAVWISDKFRQNGRDLTHEFEETATGIAKFVVDHYFNRADNSKNKQIKKFTSKHDAELLRRLGVLNRDEQIVKELVQKLNSVADGPGGFEVVIGKGRPKNVIRMKCSFPSYDYEHNLRSGLHP